MAGFLDAVSVTSNVIERNLGSKGSLYRFYDANGNEIDQTKVGSEDQKKLRNKLRKELATYCNQILVAYKSRNVELCAQLITNFLVWAKKNYKSGTVLSQATFRSKIGNDADAKLLEDTLNVVAAYHASKADAKQDAKGSNVPSAKK